MKASTIRRTNRIRWIAAWTAIAALAVLLAPLISTRFTVQAQSTAIQLTVDLTEAPRHIFHAHLVVPAKPGPFSLSYPKWIPGEHMPDGPISDLAGLKFTVNGKPIQWRRDDVDMWTFHMDIPAGVTSVQVDLDYLNPVEGNGYSAGPSATSKIVILEWNDVLLYPTGAKSDDVTYAPHLLLPPGWSFGTALDKTRQDNSGIQFAPVTLSNLVDSPVLAGVYFRSIPLAPEITPPHHLDLAGDSAESVDIPAEELEAYNRLIRETGALWGARHYDHYDFLLSLTDHFSPNGLEHHQSSDNRAPERTLLDPDLREEYADLLPHEFTHSWNGKYRRPAGLATGDYFTPMRGDLLWVYEGMTQYYGELLSERAGVRTDGMYREALAYTGAYLDYQAGREWRSLEDTAVAAQTLYLISGKAWFAWRRSVDFYDESWLIWLEADTVIRKQTGGKKSLDDFCRLFEGAPSTGPKLIPYTYDDVVNAMNQVTPYDWNKFFRDRLDFVGQHAPLGGIDAGGWKLIYDDAPNAHMESTERTDGTIDLTFSLGMQVGRDGGVEDVIPNMPAAQSGLAPGMKILTINGRTWSPDVLHDAVRATAQNAPAPIVINADNEGYAKAYNIMYKGGEKYPHLARDPSKPDVLGDILKPLTPVTSAASK